MDIPRIHKETVVFDPENTIEGNVSEAGTKATDYVTDITGGGIMVHPSDDSTSGWKIASAIELLKSGASYIKMWLDGSTPKLRLGRADKAHVTLSGSSMDVSDGSASVASLGSTARIGKDGSNPHFLLKATSLEAYDANGKYFSVSRGGMSFGANDVAKSADIPTKVSELTNDSSFATTTQAQGYADAKDTAISNAAKTATNFVTEVSEHGIWVTPRSNKPSNGAATSTTRGWHIADVLDYFMDGVSVIKAYVESSKAKLRVGRVTSGRVMVTEDYVTVLRGTSTDLRVDSNGMVVGPNGTMVIKPLELDVRAPDNARSYFNVKLDSAGSSKTHVIRRQAPVLASHIIACDSYPTAVKVISTASNGTVTVETLTEITDYAVIPGVAPTVLEDDAYRQAMSGSWYTVRLNSDLTVGSYASRELVIEYQASMREYSVRIGSDDDTHVTVDNGLINMVGNSGVVKVGVDSATYGNPGIDIFNASGTELAEFRTNSTGAQIAVPNGLMYLMGNANDWLRAGNGSVGGSRAYSNLSDRRLKEHIEYLGEDADDFVRSLKPALFEFMGNVETGFYAQDVQESDPWDTDMVQSGPAMGDDMPDEVLSLSYSAIIAPLVAYCQHLERRIEALEGGE